MDCYFFEVQLADSRHRSSLLCSVEHVENSSVQSAAEVAEHGVIVPVVSEEFAG